uniref:G patch domain and KOW motifs-containing protein n=1 Tax=Cacopsylla melanoneura TaxID=428564 RepID=A0A8D8YV67_9HEMI
MAEEKKISFGFSKLKAPSKVIPVAAKPNSSKSDDNTKQFIDCLENHSIKVKNGTVEEKKELVIPLKQSNVRTINIKKEPELLKIIKEETEGDSNGANAADTTADSNQEAKPSDPTVTVKVEVDEKESLDAQARREILANLGKTGETENETKVFSLPLTTNAPKEGEKESTLDDYDNIPIQEFGLAMLRGMGWKPDPNKNKNKPTDVVLRPKGLGLGADRSSVTQTAKANSNTEDSKLIKNCCVKITGGISKNCYGKLESFNEDSGRVVVKLAIRDEHVTVSETLLIRVTKDEYDKNSRVINMNKYEEYREKETTQETKPDNHYKQRKSSDEEQTRRKPEREHSKYRDDSDSERERRRDRKYKTSNESRSQDRYKEKSSKNESSKSEKERSKRRDSYTSESEEDSYKSSRLKSNKDSSDKYQSSSRSSRDNAKKTFQKDNRNNSDAEHEYYDRKRKEHKSTSQKEVTSKKHSSKPRASSTSSSSSEEEEVSKKSSKHSKYVEKSSKKKYEEKKKKHSEKDKKKSKRKRRHSSSESEESSSSDSSEEERKKKKKKQYL